MRIVVLVLILALGFGSAARAFDLDNVAAKAAELAQQPYQDRQKKVPDWMLVGSMTYDQWRDIRFRPDQALWRDKNLPFQVQFFHPGLYYDRTVQVNVVGIEEYVAGVLFVEAHAQARHLLEGLQREPHLPLGRASRAGGRSGRGRPAGCTTGR